MGKEAGLHADDSRIRELDADAEPRRNDHCGDVLGIVLAGVHAWGDCPLEQVVCPPLLPIMSETSIQAQFLIPMVISLSFGVLFATGVTLVLVPALYLVGEQFQDRFLRRRSLVVESGA